MIPWLRAQVRAHNIHAFVLGILSLVAAVLAWNLAWFFFVLILLGLVTSARGEPFVEMPSWISLAALGLALVLLVWGTIDHARKRFAGATDRPIIGWHLFGEFLLLPVRLTFAIWGNFAAIRRLDAAQLARMAELLETIHRAGKARLGALALVEPDPSTLHRLLETLQFTGLIDLHRGEGEWFYTVRSTREPELRKHLEGASHSP
jgi:hypothetical protein